MTSKVAFLLRAVNVGRNKVPMADLRTLADDLGATEVATYVNSGNLVCVPPGDADEFGAVLADGILDRMGVTTDAIPRTGDELRAALTAYPLEIHEPKFCHVWFFAAAPSREAAAAVQAYDFGDDQLRVVGRELYVRYADGAGRSAVTAPRLLKLAGVQGTGRNLNTVDKLATMAGA